MRCLFCKQDSSNSKSVEHIIPESLENTTLVLPKGVVCDKCNNYFARKVEQPFLESIDIRALRFREAIPNKRGIIPPLDGILNGDIPIKVHNPFPGILLFAKERDAIIAIDSEHTDITKIPHLGKIITPAFVDEMIPQNTTIISRFVAKIALESMALRLSEHEGGLDYLIDESAYDPIRGYVRFGNAENWACNIRRLYDMDKLWRDNIGNQYQNVHESDFLLIPVDNSIDILNDNPVLAYLFFIFAVFGLEFVINMAAPDVDGLEPYKKWVHKHRNVSPLYYGKNESSCK
jgi:hypothetical protein